MGIYSVISTDAIREVLRAAVPEGLNPALHKSTYFAGKSENYQSKNKVIQKEKIIRGFKMQAQAVGIGIDGLINRSLKENSAVIIEGVHIIPCQYQEPVDNRVLQYFVDIAHPEIHRKRLEMRSNEAPQRKLAVYFDNFKEICWIQDYLRRKAKEAQNIIFINNEGSLDKSVEQSVKAYWNRFSH